MRARPTAALQAAVVGPLVEGYQRLSVNEVMADLPSLGREELHFVQSLEEMAGRRAQVGDRILELLASLDEPHKADDTAARATPRPATPTRRVGGLIAVRSPGHTPASPNPPPSISEVRRRPRRARASARARWVAALAAIAVIGAGAVMTIRAMTARTLPGAPAFAAPTGGSRVVRDPLERLLVAAPAASTRAPGSAASTGPLDLAHAAGDDGGVPGTQSVLSRDGFVHGFQRVWMSADQSQITASMFQFKSSAGAAAYARDMVSESQSNPQYVADFEVPEVPGAVGLTSAATGDVTATIVMTKGSYLVRLAVNAVSGNGLTRAAQELARAQYRVL